METIGLVLAERAAAVDDFLAAPLHLGVVALDARRNRDPPRTRPEAMDEAAPPPRPMSMAGPPSTMMAAPAGTSPFLTSGRRMLPKPPAIMMGLW